MQTFSSEDVYLLYSENLLPGASRPVAPTLDEYRALLLAEVLPDAQGEFSAQTDALEAYVSEQLSRLRL